MRLEDVKAFPIRTITATRTQLKNLALTIFNTELLNISQQLIIRAPIRFPVRRDSEFFVATFAPQRFRFCEEFFSVVGFFGQRIRDEIHEAIP